MVSSQLVFNIRSKRKSVNHKKMVTLKWKLLYYILPILIFVLLSDILLTMAYMQNVRIAEIPFGHSDAEYKSESYVSSSGIYAKSKLDEHRSFLHIFNVPYIVCFFASKGKWPFIPPFMQQRVDSTAKTVFSQNDSYIRQFCSKWMQIKQCFRPIFTTTTEDPVRAVESLAQRATPCTCANLVSTETPVPIIFFDRDHIGNVSAETVRNTIEFLETFLPPPPTRTKKRKNRVRSRLDEIDID